MWLLLWMSPLMNKQLDPTVMLSPFSVFYVLVTVSKGFLKPADLLLNASC